MTAITRQNVANWLVFQDEHIPVERRTQRIDVIDEDNGLSTYIIAILDNLRKKGWYVCVTSARRDHGDDSDLGPHCHAHGYAIDIYPLASGQYGHWLDCNSEAFENLLHEFDDDSLVHDVGLGGDAYTKSNMNALGELGFEDNSQSHIHISSVLELEEVPSSQE